MSSPFPPETLDLIIDYLHDEPTTLRTCCVVSKSWVQRTRRHLFAHVEFSDPYYIKLWKETFPDPSNSPAHHTHTLSVSGTPVILATDAAVGGWIHTFRNVIHLSLSYIGQTSLLPFYALSPTLRSLSLTQVPLDAFDIVCFFPLLEDLALVDLFDVEDRGGWKVPSVPPKLTGTLDFRMSYRPRPVARRLLDLPGGLHFSEIFVMFFSEDVESVMDAVSRCSDSLELLTLRFYHDRSAFPSALVTGQYLTTTRTLRHG